MPSTILRPKLCAPCGTLTLALHSYTVEEASAPLEALDPSPFRPFRSRRPTNWRQQQCSFLAFVRQSGRCAGRVT